MPESHNDVSDAARSDAAQGRSGANATDGSVGAEGTVWSLELLLALANHKALCLGFPLLVALAVAVVVLIIPNTYTASARILPPQQNQSGASLVLGQIGGLGAGAAGLLSVKNPNDLYVGMLRSRTVADSLVQRFDLRRLYETETLVETRKALEQHTAIAAGRDGLIAIEVDDRDPQRAANLANAYVEELAKLTQTLAVTEAAQRRLFFEKQLQVTRDALADAELKLKETQEDTGLIQLDEQGKALIEGIARLRAEIVAREVQMSAIRTFATERNPDYLLLQQQLAALRNQLSKLERAGTAGEDSSLIATGKVPEAGLMYLRRLRDVKYYETVLELLAKQYELAKVDEARDTSIVQVLDAAVPPDRKSKPKRLLIVFLSGLTALILGIVAALALESLQRAARQPGTAERLTRLQLALPLRLPGSRPSRGARR